MEGWRLRGQAWGHMEETGMTPSEVASLTLPHLCAADAQRASSCACSSSEARPALAFSRGWCAEAPWFGL